MKLSARLFTLLSALVLSVGCGPIIDPDGAWADLGQGEESFVVTEDGDLFEAEFGSQGGQHIWVSARFYGIDPGPSAMWQGLAEGTLPIVSFELSSPDGLLSAQLERPFVLERVEGGEYQISHFLLSFNLTPDDQPWWDQGLTFEEAVALLEDTDLELRVTLSDNTGIQVSAMKQIRVTFGAQEPSLG